MSSPNSQKLAAATAIAVALASPMEGMRQVAYRDPPGILTVCEGHTGPDIDPHKVYSIQECKALMSADMRKAVDEVSACAPDAPKYVLAAFSDAAYNIGSRVACDRSYSTAAKLLYEHDWSGACQQLPKWDKTTIAGVRVRLPGLTKRRALEEQVCMKGFA